MNQIIYDFQLNGDFQSIKEVNCNYFYESNKAVQAKKIKLGTTSLMQHLRFHWD